MYSRCKENRITASEDLAPWMNTSLGDLTSGRYRVRVKIIPQPQRDIKYRSFLSDVIPIEAIPVKDPEMTSRWEIIWTGVAALVFIIFVLVVFIWRGGWFKKRRMGFIPGQDVDKDLGELPPLFAVGDCTNCFVPQSRNFTEWGIRDEKHVLLLFSDDFPAHEEVVHNFASFLDHHCGCAVSLDPWREHGEPSPINWNIGELQKAHCIIIIASEGAYKKHQASMQNVPLKDISNKPRCDVFAQIIHLINTRYMSSDNFKPAVQIFMVWFPYSSKDHLLGDIQSRVICFELMQDIADLVLAIHGLQSHDSTLRNYIPSITGDKFKNFEEGRILYSSIQTAKRYTDENPNWFKERFTDRSRQDSGLGFDIPWPKDSQDHDAIVTLFDEPNRFDEYLLSGYGSSETLDLIEQRLTTGNAKFNESIQGTGF